MTDAIRFIIAMIAALSAYGNAIQNKPSLTIFWCSVMVAAVLS